MKIRSLTQISLTLMLLAACGPNTQLPASVNSQNSQTSASGTSAGQTGGSASTSASTSTALKSDLTAQHEEEALYADAATISDSQTGFATQAVGAAAAINARPRLVAGASAVVEHPVAAARDLQLKAKARLAIAAAQRNQLKAHLLAADAVTLNADGTITLDTAAFVKTVNQKLQIDKAALKARIARLDARLALKREIGGDLLKRLYHHDFVVRTSDKTSETNSDGSTTETLKISFENSRLNIHREMIVAKTSLDGKLLKIDYQLSETNPAFERSVNRITTVNADGTRNVLIDAKTTWKDGRSSERHEERLVSADGSATGTGTLTRTAADGTVKTFTLSLNLTADGQLTSNATDASGQTDVVVDEQADGSATVITSENGAESAETVDIAAEASAEASAGSAG